MRTFQQLRRAGNSPNENEETEQTQHESYNCVDSGLLKADYEQVLREVTARLSSAKARAAWLGPRAIAQVSTGKTILTRD